MNSISLTAFRSPFCSSVFFCYSDCLFQLNRDQNEIKVFDVACCTEYKTAINVPVGRITGSWTDITYTCQCARTQKGLYTSLHFMFFIIKHLHEMSTVLTGHIGRVADVLIFYSFTASECCIKVLSNGSQVPFSRG